MWNCQKNNASIGESLEAFTSTEMDSLVSNGAGLWFQFHVPAFPQLTYLIEKGSSKSLRLNVNW